MVIEDLIYLLPATSVVVFSLVERLLFNKTAITTKTQPIFFIVALNLLVSLGFAAVLLIPFVMLVAPLQLLSIAELNIPGLWKVILSLLVIDLAHYLSHLLHHKVPMLWRLHRLHHSDAHINVQTTLLHHPLEVVSNSLLSILVAVILDIPTIALFYYSLIMGVHAAFTHSNTLLPERAEKIIRWFFTTPNYHFRHHAKDLKVSNNNFGIVFIYWDVLFNTSLFHDDKGSVDYGIRTNEAPKKINIWHFLINPLR